MREDQALSCGTQLGRRERNKLDKLNRIKKAAHALFRERGFDRATTREIAKRAGVGIGTVFSYATEKRDLLLLIYGERFEAARADFKGIDPRRTFVGNLIELFRPYYVLFASEPEIMRDLLRELSYFTHGLQLPRMQAGRQELLKMIANVVTDAKKQGVLGTSDSAQAVARLIFGILQAEIRIWIAGDKPVPEEGLRALAAALKIFIRGLGPSRGAL